MLKADAVRGRLCAVALLVLGATGLQAQQPSKEYIRLGGRVIAIENYGIAVTISPSSATVGPGGQVQFTATVSGTTNTAVTWSVQGGGTVSASGLYTAPTGISSPVTATVTATSQADTSKSATATVTVNLIISVTVTVSPTSATLLAGWQTQLTATVAGDTGQGVTWSLSPNRGTLSSNGLAATYQAPTDVASTETVSVRGTSNADPTKYADSTITINPNRPPTLVSVTPNSGSGSRVALTFTASDPDGYADIDSMQVILDWILGSSRCHVFYIAGLDGYSLETDGGGWSPVYFGTSQSATNSNCTVYGAGSSVSRSGNSLSLTVDFEFKAQFSGMKRLYLVASDKATIVGYGDMGRWLAPGVPGTSQAALVSMSAPDEVLPGQSFTGTVTMRNTGQNYWQSGDANPQQPHRLGSQNPGDNERWGLSRVGMSTEEVQPGADMTFQFTARAPTTPGTYAFDWRMVHDAVEWFGPTATKTITVRSNEPYPESPHPYWENFDQTWTYTLPGSPGSIYVTFDYQTSVEYGYDYIYVMDGSGIEVPGSPFTGTALSGQTLLVPGGTVLIRLTSDYSVNDWGFAVTSVTAGP